MSATMRKALADLLLRKTQEARARAKDTLKGWQSVLQAVRHAEQMADCRIDLPPALDRDGLEKTAAELKKANYIIAVNVERRAITLRAHLLEFTITGLQGEVDRRRQDASNKSATVSFQVDHPSQYLFLYPFLILISERMQAFALSRGHRPGVLFFVIYSVINWLFFTFVIAMAVGCLCLVPLDMIFGGKNAISEVITTLVGLFMVFCPLWLAFDSSRSLNLRVQDAIKGKSGVENAQAALEWLTRSIPG